LSHKDESGVPNYLCIVYLKWFCIVYFK
jgi:hypothetical protein